MGKLYHIPLSSTAEPHTGNQSRNMQIDLNEHLVNQGLKKTAWNAVAHVICVKHFMLRFYCPPSSISFCFSGVYIVGLLKQKSKVW